LFVYRNVDALVPTVFHHEINKLTMPPRKSNTLTEAELRLMKILWRRGESAVTDMVDALPEGEQLAYNSVLTTVRILEQKGYVEHRQEGRAFVYWPCVEENEASSSEVRNVLSRFFGNSREKLVLSLLGDDGISAEELARLRDAIRSASPDREAIRDAAPNKKRGGR
jgi:BlaI family transcriptional regulator, penicillinase repressor